MERIEESERRKQLREVSQEKATACLRKPGKVSLEIAGLTARRSLATQQSHFGRVLQVEVIVQLDFTEPETDALQ